MKPSVVPSQYLQIALDLATRIARGELPEGSRIYGRSVMASEYNVSPETIRRALRLLADMKVVEVKPQSGAVVLSADSARRYIANFEENADVHALRQQLRDLMAEYTDLSHRMADTVTALIKSRDTFAAAGEPLPNYEVPVPKDSPLIGKSIGAEILAVHRRHHRRYPPGADRHPLPRPLCRAVCRGHHRAGGQPRRRGGGPSPGHRKGVSVNHDPI